MSKPRSLTLEELYQKLQYLYLLFRDKDFFKGKAGITKANLPEAIMHEAALDLNFQPNNVFSRQRFRRSRPGRLDKKGAIMGRSLAAPAEPNRWAAPGN
jgi:hypothetical protein